MNRVGFILDSQPPTLANLRAGRVSPGSLLTGHYSGSSVANMRFRWVSDWVNVHCSGTRFELWRPWRRYHAVVFMKSMGQECESIARQLKGRGTKVYFDCNVDYLTPATGRFYYEGMAPREDQRAACRAMLDVSEGVIADSSHIQKQLSKAHPRVTWIPDNVKDAMVDIKTRRPTTKPLVLQWSGEAVKLFDLLVLKDLLSSYAKHVKLRLVTSDLAALKRWPDEQRTAFDQLLASVPHEIVPFTSLESLLSLYDQSDVVLSPRFLDNSYNLGHTEWKITLGMARGCVALCSPQPSYVDVSERAGGRGIRVCQTSADWSSALDALLDASYDWSQERAAAVQVVKQHYSTSIVAKQYADWLTL